MFTSMTLQDIGNNVRVPCRAHGLPRPRVYWTKDGVLVNKPRFVFHENGDMEISNLQWADMGTYTCVAENSLGKESTSTFIYPMKTRNSAIGVGRTLNLRQNESNFESECPAAFPMRIAVIRFAKSETRVA
ncbi:unnamed protein product [Nesidiocoris tenuis]|uniref:Ig-like domain-containing protein n=1 Tax=Nesidiocoris tenuis TaxID=355587 RepID=A0A6H5HNY8_9HEMI|nr:unnamed protein product [Nesidiocoris tenuis]